MISRIDFNCAYRQQIEGKYSEFIDPVKAEMYADLVDRSFDPLKSSYSYEDQLNAFVVFCNSTREMLRQERDIQDVMLEVSDPGENTGEHILIQEKRKLNQMVHANFYSAAVISFHATVASCVDLVEFVACPEELEQKRRQLLLSSKL